MRWRRPLRILGKVKMNVNSIVCFESSCKVLLGYFWLRCGKVALKQ